jgi:hypothetical protein
MEEIGAAADTGGGGRRDVVRLCGTGMGAGGYLQGHFRNFTPTLVCVHGLPSVFILGRREYNKAFAWRVHRNVVVSGLRCASFFTH